MSETRGERNRNPGNVEDDGKTKWQGLDDPRSDGRFLRFANPEDGIRCLCRVLLTYQRKYGIRSIRGIINRWAPSHENNTESYIKHVAGACGVDSREVIDLTDRHFLKDLVEAIIKHENGRCTYEDSVIAEGVKRALQT